MGNTRSATDFNAPIFTTKTSFKETFDEVVALMTTSHVFGKDGYTNVSKDHITKKIETFERFGSVACTGQFPSLTFDERCVLVLVLRRVEAVCVEWTKVTK
jgi:hypothetical protein